MNRFIINYSPDLIARDLCDKHVVKMPLEEAQMLCTSVRLHAPEYPKTGLYRAVHRSTHAYGQGYLVPTMNLTEIFVGCARHTTDTARHTPHGDCGMHL